MQKASANDLGLTGSNVYIKFLALLIRGWLFGFSSSSVCTVMYFGVYLLFLSSEDVQTVARCVIVCPLAANQKKPMNGPIRNPGLSDEE
jgi:hypothetical protein